MALRGTKVRLFAIAIGAAALALGSPAEAEVTGSDYYQGIEAYKRKDYKTAYEKLKPLADSGIAQLQFRIGLMHFYGHGVPENKKEARLWFQKAAVQGNGEAQGRLGDMYLRGDGISKNLPRAIWWIERSANQDYGRAQYSMAYMYLNALGLEKDIARAYAWLTRAVNMNYTPAAKLRDELLPNMAPAEIDLAVKQARGLAADHLGTGVVMNSAGYVVSAYHLVDGCRRIQTLGDKPQQLALKGYDVQNDLALLKQKKSSDAAAKFPWEKKVEGDQVIFHAGLAAHDVDATEPKVGKGKIADLKGPNKDQRFLKLEAKMAENESGGPVFDSGGRLVGISLARDQVLALTGVNANAADPSFFAINAAVVRDFLDYYKVPHARAKAGGATISDKDAFARVRAVTVPFACYR